MLKLDDESKIIFKLLVIKKGRLRLKLTLSQPGHFAVYRLLITLSLERLCASV